MTTAGISTELTAGQDQISSASQRILGTDSDKWPRIQDGIAAVAHGGVVLNDTTAVVHDLIRTTARARHRNTNNGIGTAGEWLGDSKGTLGSA